jgi:hypothetical protein
MTHPLAQNHTSTDAQHDDGNEDTQPYKEIQGKFWQHQDGVSRN